MIAIVLIPAVLSMLVLGAHFMRSGNMLIVVACVAVNALLLVPRRFVVRLFQGLLVLAGLEWCRTMYVLYQQRQADGEPALRMLAILGVVAAVAFVSAVAFELPVVRRRYR